MRRELTFGAWMRQIRTGKRLSATECAVRAGMELPVWSNWENDRSRRKDGRPSQPRQRTIESIARALDVSVADAMFAAYGREVPAQGDDWQRIYERIPPSRRARFLEAVKAMADAIAV